jgi:hypothetical protein
MELTTMQIQSSLEANQQKHMMFGNILQLQIILKQKKADQRMLVVFFCEKLFSGWPYGSNVSLKD